MYTFTAQSVEPICSQKNGKNLSYFHKISEKWLSKFACIFPRWKSQGKWTFCMCGVISTANGLQIHYSQKNINFLKMDRKVAAEKQGKSFHLIYTKTRLIFWGKSHRMSILERHTLPGSMVPMLVFLFSGIGTRFGDEKQNSFLMHFSVKITCIFLTNWITSEFRIWKSQLESSIGSCLAAVELQWVMVEISQKNINFEKSNGKKHRTFQLNSIIFRKPVEFVVHFSIRNNSVLSN